MSKQKTIGLLLILPILTILLATAYYNLGWLKLIVGIGFMAAVFAGIVGLILILGE